MFNQDYKDMLEILSKNQVEFVIVGAYALAAHGFPRATGDIDIFINPTPENAQRVFDCIAEFGAPVSDLKVADLAEVGNIYQIGVAPCRIDLITRIDAVGYAQASENKNMITIDDLDLPFLSRDDLIRNKSATGRKKDLLDIEILRENEA